MWNHAPENPMLTPDEIHIWRVELDVSEPELAQLRQTLSSDELARAARFHFERDQRRFTAGRGFLRALLATYLGQPPAALRFSYGVWGKPSLYPSSKLRFNLSHSHDLALYAVSIGRDVGIDVERFDARLGSVSFIEEWTRHEASLKAAGTGFMRSDTDGGEEWLVRPVFAGSEYAAAVAAKPGAWSIRLWDWRPVKLPASGRAESETRKFPRDECR
jgi:hypothetical protein